MRLLMSALFILVQKLSQVSFGSREHGLSYLLGGND